jgi:SulP family sulfate permease
LAAIRFDGALRFVNVSYFEDALLTLERKNPNVRYILVKCNGVNYLDASGVEMLLSLVTRFKSNGITLGFSGLKKQVLDVMDKTNLAQIIGHENIFPTDQDAFNKLHARGVVDVKLELRPQEPTEHLLPA